VRSGLCAWGFSFQRTALLGLVRGMRGCAAMARASAVCTSLCRLTASRWASRPRVPKEAAAVAAVALEPVLAPLQTVAVASAVLLRFCVCSLSIKLSA
jgi:hypothetical protein